MGAEGRLQYPAEVGGRRRRLLSRLQQLELGSELLHLPAQVADGAQDGAHRAQNGRGGVRLGTVAAADTVGEAERRSRYVPGWADWTNDRLNRYLYGEK